MENKEMTESDELRVIVLSHCILNRSTRWWQNGKSTRNNRGLTIQILNLLSRLEIGVIQLPCPEFTFCGNPRPPRTRDEYASLPGFQQHCANLADEASRYLRDLIEKAQKPPIRILAIVGVERSPTCGVKCTPIGKGGSKRYIEEKGIFIEMLMERLEEEGLKIPVVGVDLDKPEEFIKIIDKLNRG